MRLTDWVAVVHNRVRCYQATNLKESGLVNHGFSTRLGGISPKPYDKLNLGLGVDDDPDNVVVNRRRFAGLISVDAERLVVPAQVHSCTVGRVDETFSGSGAAERASSVPDTDALITNVPGVPLALHFADCVCIMLLDAVNRAIGVVHAGWRGTASGITLATVEAMMSEFGSSPEDLQAAIAPAIGSCCFIIGEDAAKPLDETFPCDARVLSRFSADKWRADLKTANRILLVRAGVKESNIAQSEQCTSCNRVEFFSYRRDGETGRMGGCMCLL